MDRWRELVESELWLVGGWGAGVGDVQVRAWRDY